MEGLSKMFGEPDLTHFFEFHRVTPNCQNGITLKFWRFIFVWGGADCRGLDVVFIPRSGLWQFIFSR